MKKISIRAIMLVALIVFVFCFVLGKVNVTKNNNNLPENETKKENISEEIILPTSEISINVEKPKMVEEEKELSEKNTPPDRMYFPCGKTVLKQYSQQAVYSKTTGDWRAHTGIDYKAETGSEVISVWDGVVKDTYKDSLWGVTVEIEHEGEITSVYKNLDENIFVKKGESVTKGQAIGKVGDTAGIEKKDEPHLHFEIQVDEQPINPESYVY